MVFNITSLSLIKFRGNFLVKWLNWKEGLFYFIFFEKPRRNIPSPTGVENIDHVKLGERVQTALGEAKPPIQHLIFSSRPSNIHRLFDDNINLTYVFLHAQQIPHYVYEDIRGMGEKRWNKNIWTFWLQIIPAAIFGAKQYFRT